MGYLDPGGDRKSAEDAFLAVSFAKVLLHPGRSRHQRAQAREGMVAEEVGAGSCSGPGGSDPSWFLAWGSSQGPVSPGPQPPARPGPGLPTMILTGAEVAAVQMGWGDYK